MFRTKLDYFHKHRYRFSSIFHFPPGSQYLFELEAGPCP